MVADVSEVVYAGLLQQDKVLGAGEVLVLSGDLEVGAGVTLWLSAGARLDLNGYQLLNHGELRLSGDEGTFAEMSNGVYVSSGDDARLIAYYAELQGVRTLSAGAEGALVLTKSVLLDTHIQALEHNIIIDSAWVDSRLDLGTEGASVSTSTFLNSLVTAQEGALGTSGSSAFSQVNFVHDDIAIALQASAQPGESQVPALVILEGYINTAEPERKLVDADDDPGVMTDIDAASFASRPYLNTAEGFAVGTYLIPIEALGDATSVDAEHSLSVVVQPGVLAAEAVCLHDVKERLVFRDGELVAHTVRYANLDFNYADIDVLIAAVARDGMFTAEFRAEMIDAQLPYDPFSYADALSLLGVKALGDWILRVAGADGDFVA